MAGRDDRFPDEARIGEREGEEGSEGDGELENRVFPMAEAQAEVNDGDAGA